MSSTTTMTENGRILLPVEIRRAAKIEPKEILIVTQDACGVHLQTKRQALRAAQELTRSLIAPGRSLSQELLTERKLESAREANE